MATVASVLKSTGRMIAEPLFCVGLKAILEVPVDGIAKWVKSRFADHSTALPNAIAAANDRAWQAVGLALAGDTLLGRLTGLFRDGDLKAVQAQIRTFVTDADTGLDGQPAGLRARACDELNRLQRAGRLGANDVRLESLDLTRFAGTAKVADDAHSAVQSIADDLKADAPHLAQVLTLTPPGGGTPLLAAAFAYFLRREIATNAELARELTHDQLRLLSQKQQAGFANLEQALADRFDNLFETLGGWFATTDSTLDELRADLKKLLELNQVATKAESPLRISVTSAEELSRLKKVRDRLRAVPAELIDAKLFAQLGDGEAAAGQFAAAEKAHAAAANAAKESADTTAEADAAYKQFKDACELKRWAEALTALQRAVTLDEKRFRPVPKHYIIDSILGAGAFGVVLKCRNTIIRVKGVELVCAVKTFRETDLERPLADVFAEANTIKGLTHANVIGVMDFGFADSDAQTRPFLAMEFFPGVTLEDHLAAHGKLSVTDFRAVFGQIATGLHAAHTADEPVIHRDLKPANIMLMKVNGAWVVKVIDFGLAVRSVIRVASVSVPRDQRSTRDKAVAGTVKYAAPEQMQEKPYPVGPHSDVYAFGKTALESLLGTVNPTQKHWTQLGELADLLARCVDEEFIAKNAADGRFHGFGPILEGLAGLQKQVEERSRQAGEEQRRLQEERRLQAEAEQLRREREEAQHREREAEERRRREESEKRHQEREMAEKLQRQEEERRQAEEAERQRHVAHAALCSANLERWKASGEPEKWVSAHLPNWADADWKQLLHDFQRDGRSWPMAEAEMGKHLEGIRDRLNEEKRQAEERRRAEEVEEKRKVELERVRKAESGKELRKLEGHTGSVYGVAFSPDGKRIVTASRDETARVWDAESGKELRKLEGHTNYVLGVAFSPDGKRIVTASTDETARVWDAD